MATIDLMVPVLSEQAPDANLRMAERRAPDGTGRLVLVDNGKPKARELMELIADRLRDRGGYADVEVYAKGSASRVLDEEEAADLASRADAVVAGLGDCGACSACSLGDALRMEGVGVPSTVLISDVFTNHVASFAATMGLPGYHMAVVPHPVSSKDTDTLATYADAVADSVAEQLLGRQSAPAL